MSSYAIFAENFLQALSAGLLLGAVYALMCVGLGMIFGVMKVINFAQGEFLMLGMYGTFFIYGSLSFESIFGSFAGPVIAALLSGAALFVIGAAVQRFLLARVTGREAAAGTGDGHFPQLILTLGLALIVSNGALMAFGSVPRSIRTDYSSSAWELGPLLGDAISIFFNKARVLSLLVTIVLGAALFFWVTRSTIGKSLRAAADNPIAATYMGIDVQKVFRVAFGLGCAVTGIAGGLMASYLPFQPYTGIEFVTVMYAGVVLGGLGSIAGAFWGGLAIGLIQQLSTLVLPTQLQNAAIFVVFLLIILLRPQGFFGRNVERT
jgi:branched-chain amino acid transport system permease protein